jgi:hypothetical protein
MFCVPDGVGEARTPEDTLGVTTDVCVMLGLNRYVVLSPVELKEMSNKNATQTPILALHFSGCNTHFKADMLSLKSSGDE